MNKCLNNDKLREEYFLSELRSQTFYPGWISVKDKLPEPNNWIIYAVLTREPKLYRHQMAYFSTSRKWIRQEEQQRIIKVTHWMMLPELPV